MQDFESAGTDVGTSWSGKSAVIMTVGILLFLAGLVVSSRVFHAWGEDFAPQYVAAKFLVQGRNVYSMDEATRGYLEFVGERTTWAHFYPPASAFVALPATLIPYPAARELWFGASILLLAWGVWATLGLFAPKTQPDLRVLAMGLVMCASCTRWAFKVAQPVALFTGLLALFLVALSRNRKIPAFTVAAIVFAMKPTFALPFLGLALLRGRYGMVAGVVAVYLALNGVGFARMGGAEAVRDYQVNMTQFERPDELNYPDPRGVNSLARLDWPYLINAVNPIPPNPLKFRLANRVGAILSLLSALWLLRKGWQARAGHKAAADNPALMAAFLAPLCALTMLSVYHHHYDVGLLVVPTLAWISGVGGLRRLPGALWFLVPLILYMGLWPAGQAEDIVERFVGDTLSKVLIKPVGCAIVTVAFIGSLVALHRFLALRAPIAPETFAPAGVTS